MVEGPYFVVEKGTNKRWTTGKDQTPEIYDTEEITQIAIGDRMEARAKMKMKTIVGFEPITVAEYNRKYAKIMGIKED